MIITLAKEFRLPAIYPDRIFVELAGVHDSAERAKRHYSRMVPVDILWAPDDWENETV